MVFQWTEDLSLGIDIIDTQHKAIIQQINRLVEALEADRSRDEVRGVVNFLEDYIFQHFAQEEGIMKEYQYPEFARHRELHADFVRNFAVLRSHLLVSEITPALMINFKHAVEEWIEDHLLKDDKALAEFIKAEEQVEVG
jgi:hemerythrin